MALKLGLLMESEGGAFLFLLFFFFFRFHVGPVYEEGRAFRWVSTESSPVVTKVDPTCHQLTTYWTYPR
jgi:hypothetical protein